MNSRKLVGTVYPKETVMNKRTWDLYAPIYKTAMKADAKTYKMMYDRIPKVIKDKEVLEIATGPGLLAKNVAHAAKKMIATDYSDGMIAQAKKGKYPGNLTFEVADVMSLPYEDGSFDVVLIANCLHLLTEPEKALVQISRVLRDGGILIAPTFVHHERRKGGGLWTKILKLAGVHFAHEWSKEEFEQFLEDNGWKVNNSKLLQARIAMDYVECSKAMRKG